MRNKIEYHLRYNWARLHQTDKFHPPCTSDGMLCVSGLTPSTELLHRCSPWCVLQVSTQLYPQLSGTVLVILEGPHSGLSHRRGDWGMGPKLCSTSNCHIWTPRNIKLWPIDTLVLNYCQVGVIVIIVVLPSSKIKLVNCAHKDNKYVCIVSFWRDP